MMKSFETRWKEMPVHPESPAFQRVDESHPLDFYLGKEASGDWVLLLITDEQPAASREYRAIHVIRRERQDGRYALLFRLVSPELERLFSLLCEDLVEYSRNIQDPNSSASFVLARFARWQRLLERGQSGLLDDLALEGLMGELTFLEKRAIPSRGVREAVNGWIGPNGAARDFRFADHEYEIKAIPPTSNRVLISSAEQLDLQTKPLDLFVVVLEPAEPHSHAKAFTALEIVQRLMHSMQGDPIALQTFESKLLDAGFIDREEYGDRAYIFRRFRAFRINEAFPAIRRSSLPAAVGKVVWELELAAVKSFELSSEIT